MDDWLDCLQKIADGCDEEIGDILKSARLRQGLSIRDLEAEIPLTKSTIERYEKGQTIVKDLDLVAELIAYWKCDETEAVRLHRAFACSMLRGAGLFE